MKKVLLIAFLGCVLFLDQVYCTVAVENSATQKEVLDIVDALIRDGKVQSNCIDAQPERDKTVKVTLFTRNRTSSSG